MKDSNGQPLRFEVEQLATKCALSIFKEIQQNLNYKKIDLFFKSRFVALFYQYIIKKTIYPYIREACVINWYYLNKKVPTKKTVTIPNYGIFPLLKKHWLHHHIKIKHSYFFWWTFFLKGYVKKIYNNLKSYFFNTSHFLVQYFSNSERPSMKYFSMPCIACHYNEGIDLKKRNDIDWILQVNDKSINVLIYFDNTGHRKKISRQTIKNITDLGFRWVALKPNLIAGQPITFWSPPNQAKQFPIQNISTSDPHGKWIHSIGKCLFKDVQFWSSFYQHFNVTVNYSIEENCEKGFAMAIAFDFMKEKGGIFIGRQRSEIFSPNEVWFGHHPRHVFFSWNKILKMLDKENYGKIQSLVQIGYPYYIDTPQTSNEVNILKNKGMRFIITVFDNSFGKNNHFSKEEIIQFYHKFLEWAWKLKDIGIIFKSKKPHLFDFYFSSLPQLLINSCQNNFYIRGNDEFGILPYKVATGADCSIGIGISSAITELALLGAKGIHYDITKLHQHPYYKLGYNRIIFDNLDSLLNNLIHLKINPNSSKIGDWSYLREIISPFHDSSGYKRMGAYINEFITQVKKGNTSEKAISEANRSYQEKWGKDILHTYS